MTALSAIHPPCQLDYLIQSGLILPLSSEFPESFIGSIGIRGSQIVFIQPEDTPGSASQARQIIDARGFLVMPGLVNTHTHGAMTLFRGLADDLPLKTWLEQFMFPAEKKFVSPDSVYWGTLLACAEMMMSGTTTFADGYFYMDQAVKAVHLSGMRAVISQGVLDYPIPGVPDPARNISVAARFVDTWKGFSPLIHPAIFCHSPYTCSPETMRTVKSLCREKEALFFIHAAETREEVSLVQSLYGKRPIRHLDDLEILDEKSVIIHAVHLDSGEIELLSRRRSGVVHCPESNMKLASGVAPVVEMLQKGVLVGLGTDGCASNNDLDLFKEMDTAAKLHKVHLLDPTVMPDRTVLQMATLNGAAVLGLGDRIGSLEVGKQADLIFLELTKPHLVPCYDPFSILVYSAQGSDVHSVMIAGRMVMEDRRILTFELPEVLERVTRLSRLIGSSPL